MKQFTTEEVGRNRDPDPDSAFLDFAWRNLSYREKTKLLHHIPKTAWVLGAGASHHYDLNASGVQVPLARGFFRAFHDLPTSHGFHAAVGPLISFLEHKRGVPPKDFVDWQEDIEQFMTSVEASLEALRKQIRSSTPPDPLDVIRVKQAFINMTFIVANVMNEAQNGPVSPLYRKLLDCAGPHDTFVSFNWDTLLDQALAATGVWDPTNGYGLPFHAIYKEGWIRPPRKSPNTQGWQLLKLHGSTNWLVPYMGLTETLDYRPLVKNDGRMFLFWNGSLPFDTYNARWRGGYGPACYGYYPPNIPADFFPDAALRLPKGRVLISSKIRFLTALPEPSPPGIPSSPVLITPVRNKRFDLYGTIFRTLWSRAERSLRNAKRIVVIGYSFPETDRAAINLIRKLARSRTNAAEIVIVDPDPEAVARRLWPNRSGVTKDLRADLKTSAA